jgi:adenine-specific DNA methylase
VRIKTVPFKGSKRKLLNDIAMLVDDRGYDIFFDGFSGSGIVSAFMRRKGYTVIGNDKMPSCCLFARVFLQGFDAKRVSDHIASINILPGQQGWLTEYYSGEVTRVIRGTGGNTQSRPRGFTRENAMKLDAVREYADTIVDINDREAVIFSIILAANKVFNNSTDQKSCLKEWTNAALKPVMFEVPTLIEGPIGSQLNCNIIDMDKLQCDVVYLDPPYTTGVLYDAAYHLNDSIYLWDKQIPDTSYAIPRSQRAVFRKNRRSAGTFYIKKAAKADFKKLLDKFDCKRIIISYSDAPRNVLSLEELYDICATKGKTTIYARDHKLCPQPKSLNKISQSLTEFFFVIDLTIS